MTVPTTTNKVIATGNGVSTVFPFTFGTMPTGDLVVSLFDLDGAEYAQAENTDYTVSGKGVEDGGAVTFTTAPTNGWTVLIQRILPETQPTDLKNQGSFYPRTIERMFDRLTFLVQQIAERVASALTLPPQVEGVSLQLPTPDPNTIFGWNASADAIQNFPLADIATNIAYGDKSYQIFAGTGAQVNFTLSQNPGSIGNLDVSIDGVTQVPVSDFTYVGTTLTFTTAPANSAVILVRYDIAVPLGSTLSSAAQFLPGGASDPTTNVQAKLREWVSVEDSGAVGDGVTLDDAAFAKAAAKGVKVRLVAGKTYHLSQGISFSNGTGFVCPEGMATIKIKTGPGGFTNTAQGGTRTALDRCLFSMVSTNSNVIEGIEFITDGVKECCLYPIRTSGGFTTGPLRISRVRFSGFKMGVLVGLNTVGAAGYTVSEIDARDCGSAQGLAYWGAGTGQLTVFEVDNDMVAATPSVPGKLLDISGTNILHTATAVTDFGQQTDLINIAGISGTDRKGPEITKVYADGVGEVLDFFCTGAVVKGVRARNVHGFVAKFVHGAQNNEVDIDVVESFGLGCVTFAGSSSVVIDTKDNVVRVGTIRGCGDAGPGPTTANIPVVLMQENGGGAGTCLPKNNLCIIDSVVAGANLDFIVRDNCSVNNSNANLIKVSKISGSPASKFCDIAFSANTKARYLNAQPCRLSVGAVQALATGVNATVQYQTVQSDSDSLANVGTYTIAPKYPGWYRAYAQSRISGGNAADYATMRIQKNGSSLSQRVTFYGTGAVEVTPAVDFLFYVDETEVGTAAANYTVQITHVGAAAPNILNTPTMAYFEVSPTQS